MTFLLPLLSAALAMPGAAFPSFQHQVEDASFASDKLAILRTAASTNTFTPGQVATLIGEMSFASDQLSALEVLLPRMEAGDPSAILAAFTFSSDREAAQQLLVTVPRVRAPTSALAVPVSSNALSCPMDASLPALEVAWSSTWSPAELAGLVTDLERASFSDDRMAILRARVTPRPEGLSGPQVLAILHTFDFSNDLEQVLQILDDHLLGMTVAEVRTLLDAYSFSDGKLGALRVLKDTLTDVEHKHQLLDAFSFSGDKAEAARILADVRPRSFLYGTVNSQRVVFVVDVSGSMQATFRTNQGRTLSRLDFVRCELNSVITQQLLPTAQFDVIAFSSGVTPWSPSLVVADPAHRTGAQTYVAGLRAVGATNVHDALRAAFELQPDTVYFLTDGAPTAGPVRDVDSLIARVGEWSAGGVHVNSVAFLTGAHASDDKSTSRRLMKGVAEVSGGVYRAIE